MSRHTHHCTHRDVSTTYNSPLSFLKVSLPFPCCLPTLSPLPAAWQPVCSSVLSFPSHLLPWPLRYFPLVLKYFTPASELPAHCFPLSHGGSLGAQPSLVTCSLGWGRAEHLLFGSYPSRTFSQFSGAGFPIQSYLVTGLFLSFRLNLLN